MSTKLSTLLLLLGKILIAISFLCPMPLAFVLYPLVGCKEPTTMWGTWWGYWWPLFGSLALGLMLCILSKHAPKHIPEDPLGIEHSPLVITGAVIGLGITLMVVILVFIFLIIGIYYAFFSKYMPIVLPICVGIGVVGYLLYIGWKIYKNTKK